MSYGKTGRFPLLGLFTEEWLNTGSLLVSCLSNKIINVLHLLKLHCMIKEITFLKCLKDFLNAMSIYSYFKNYFKNPSNKQANHTLLFGFMHSLQYRETMALTCFRFIK